jgi:hypothetical protein
VLFFCHRGRGLAGGAWLRLHNGLCPRHHVALAFVAIGAHGYYREVVDLVAVGYDQSCPSRQCFLSINQRPCCCCWQTTEPCEQELSYTCLVVVQWAALRCRWCHMLISPPCMLHSSPLYSAVRCKIAVHRLRCDLGSVIVHGY